ncbi:SRPBCC family protein [Flaviaesturariibacter aridisoli]|uniref:DUF2892 domain-containing protein n=1 Tax=Flaviaesturariibacter aridisoli TaxID=2545761 RepID=A0A4R4E2T6_9BACT|nr:YgaP-like transmembrane domain [Flaviaesturariibacter aridisoli]TCZ72930.1 DUF2892 domain-containing protein [Flaviaesturariibacter aridisoli]
MANNENYGSWHADNEFQPQEGQSGVVNVGQTERLFSTAMGAFLLSSGLGNLFRHPVNGLLKTAIGGLLLYRGASGHCPVYSAIGKQAGVERTDAINIRTNLIVNKPKDEVYRFWRKLENLPLFMKHLASVTEIDEKHSHWEATIPGGIGKIKWNAEIVKEEEGYMIGWQSIPNATISNAGKVVFHDALGGQGTELEVIISYHAPAGELGAGLAKALNPVFERMIRQDVMNFKEYIETKHNPNAGGSSNTATSGGSNATGSHTAGGTGSQMGSGAAYGNTPQDSQPAASRSNSEGSPSMHAGNQGGGTTDNPGYQAH